MIRKSPVYSSYTYVSSSSTSAISKQLPKYKYKYKYKIKHHLQWHFTLLYCRYSTFIHCVRYNIRASQSRCRKRHRYLYLFFCYIFYCPPVSVFCFFVHIQFEVYFYPRQILSYIAVTSLIPWISHWCVSIVCHISKIPQIPIFQFFCLLCEEIYMVTI